MDRKLFKAQELSGIVISSLFVFLLWNLYSFTGGNPIGVLFGSVNGSIWEQLKPMLLCYVAYSGFELFSSKPYFRQFVAAKSLGIYAMLIVYILFRSLCPNPCNIYLNCIFTVVSFAAGYFLSRWVTLLNKPLGELFMPACFMLLLLFVMFFSFTVFPPRIWLFRDYSTGLYGIIPDYIDTGAIVLDSIG